MPAARRPAKKAATRPAAKKATSKRAVPAKGAAVKRAAAPRAAPASTEIQKALAKALAGGGHRDTLEAMARKLARDADGAGPQYVAGIMSRLQEVLADLRGLDAKDRGEVTDPVEQAKRARNVVSIKKRRRSAISED